MIKVRNIKIISGDTEFDFGNKEFDSLQEFEKFVVENINTGPIKFLQLEEKLDLLNERLQKQNDNFGFIIFISFLIAFILALFL